jgi:glycyl-tRNA synthetase beta subunit
MNYRHLSESEVRSHVENFGTDNEKTLLEMFGPVQECYGCIALEDDLSEATHEVDNLKDRILTFLDELSPEDAEKAIRKECGDDG